MFIPFLMTSVLPPHFQPDALLKSVQRILATAVPIPSIPLANLGPDWVRFRHYQVCLRDKLPVVQLDEVLSHAFAESLKNIICSEKATGYVLCGVDIHPCAELEMAAEIMIDLKLDRPVPPPIDAPRHIALYCGLDAEHKHPKTSAFEAADALKATRAKL